jgi:transposase-like protein
MSKHRKSWSETDKSNVLQHYYEHGIAATSRQFDVSSSMIYRWLSDTKATTTVSDSTGVSLADFNRLLRENQSLKELVAEKVLELRVKDALLKKTTYQSKSD